MRVGKGGAREVELEQREKEGQGETREETQAPQWCDPASLPGPRPRDWTVRRF